MRHSQARSTDRVFNQPVDLKSLGQGPYEQGTKGKKVKGNRDRESMKKRGIKNEEEDRKAEGAVDIVRKQKEREKEQITAGIEWRPM